jgi:hypothetical protein
VFLMLPEPVALADAVIGVAALAAIAFKVAASEVTEHGAQHVLRRVNGTMARPGDAGADGLMQRFQLAVYPDISSTWRDVDRRPGTAAKNRACDVICALDRLEPSAVGAEIESDDVPFLRFDEEAQERFDEWREDLEHQLRSGVEHPVIVAPLATYGGAGELRVTSYVTL